MCKSHPIATLPRALMTVFPSKNAQSHSLECSPWPVPCCTSDTILFCFPAGWGIFVMDWSFMPSPTSGLGLNITYSWILSPPTIFKNATYKSLISCTVTFFSEFFSLYHPQDPISFTKMESGLFCSLIYPKCLDHMAMKSVKLKNIFSHAMALP